MGSEGAPWNYPRYILHYFSPQAYQFNIGWLWFLPTLFGISVVSGPVFQFSENRTQKYAIIAVASWFAQVLIAKVMFGYYWIHLLFCILGPIASTVIAWYVPFPNTIDDDVNHFAAGQTRMARWTANRVLSTFNMCMCIGIVSTVWYHHEDGSPFQNAAGPAFFLNTIFYQQGYYTQRWNAESLLIESQDASDDEDVHIPTFVLMRWFFHVVMLGFLFLALCMGSPIGKMEQMIYPVYSASFEDGAFFGVFHVLGTWCYIEIAVQLFRAFCDRQIHKGLYQHAAASTIVVYIFHWMFAASVAYLVFWPLGMLGGIWEILDPVILFSITATCSVGVYFLLQKFPWVGCAFGL